MSDNALDVSEIHGFRPDLGLRVFTKDALSNQLTVDAGHVFPINGNNFVIRLKAGFFRR